MVADAATPATYMLIITFLRALADRRPNAPASDQMPRGGLVVILISGFFARAPKCWWRSECPCARPQMPRDVPPRAFNVWKGIKGRSIPATKARPQTGISGPPSPPSVAKPLKAAQYIAFLKGRDGAGPGQCIAKLIGRPPPSALLDIRLIGLRWLVSVRHSPLRSLKESRPQRNLDDFSSVFNTAPFEC